MTAGQRLEINFYSDSGTTLLGAGLDLVLANGEIVPVPEAATWVGSALLAAAVLAGKGRRLCCTWRK